MVADLLDTVLRELPAGALLVLEVGEEEPFCSRTMAGAPEKGDRIMEHLLDGQQRLTALWRSLTDNYPDRMYFVQITSDEQEDEFSATPRTVSQARWLKNEKRYPLWVDDPVRVWERRLIPVRLLSPVSKGENEFKKWAMLAARDNTDELISLISLGTELRTQFAQFNLPFLSLPTDTPKETARAVSTSLRQPGSAFTVATPRHRRGATTTDRAAVAAGQRPHAASRPGCRSSVLGHPGGWFSTAD